MNMRGIIGTTGSATESVGYTYDAANDDRSTGIVYPDGRTLTYSYGSAGSLTSAASQLTSISEGSGTIQSYSYMGLSTPVTFMDGNSVELSYVSSDGATGDAGDVVTGLDRFGRVVDQNWTGPYEEGPAIRPTIDEEQYTYDADSNVLSKENTVLTSQSESFTYDGLNRLTEVSGGDFNGSYSYNAVGDREDGTDFAGDLSYVSNAQNQLSQVYGATPGGDVDETLSYDANGNTTTDQNGQQYVYDAWNRLVKVATPGGDAITYTYDASNRLVTSTDSTSGATTDFYYSSSGQILEERQDGDVTAQFVWGTFYVKQLIQQTTAAYGTQYVEQDADWNLTSLTDTSGTVVERYAESPFGALEVLTTSGSVVGSGLANSAYGEQIGFQGGWTDAKTGLTLFGIRWVTADGTWLQEDPARYINGPDDYQLEENNPASSDDPTGLGKHSWPKQPFVPTDPSTPIPPFVPDDPSSHIPPNSPPGGGSNANSSNGAVVGGGKGDTRINPQLPPPQQQPLKDKTPGNSGIQPINLSPKPFNNQINNPPINGSLGPPNNSGLGTTNTPLPPGYVPRSGYGYNWFILTGHPLPPGMKPGQSTLPGSYTEIDPNS